MNKDRELCYSTNNKNSYTENFWATYNVLMFMMQSHLLLIFLKNFLPSFNLFVYLLATDSIYFKYAQASSWRPKMIYQNYITKNVYQKTWKSLGTCGMGGSTYQKRHTSKVSPQMCSLNAAYHPNQRGKQKHQNLPVWLHHVHQWEYFQPIQNII